MVYLIPQNITFKKSMARTAKTHGQREVEDLAGGGISPHQNLIVGQGTMSYLNLVQGQGTMPLEGK